MNKNSRIQENVKSKEYQLLAPACFRPLTEPRPVYKENPFSRSGYDVEWEPIVYDTPAAYSRDVAVHRLIHSASESGYSSKKLLCCGDVWYLKEYTDVTGIPLRFSYGPRKDAVRNLVIQNALRGWAHDDYADVEISEISEYSENASLPELPETPSHREWTEEEKQEKRKINRSHAKERCRQLINLNELHYMYTFTFAPELHENVKDLRFILPLDKQYDRHEIEHVWNKRRSAIARYFKKIGQEFRYLKVLEKHLGNKAEEESDKVGTYHIHLATDKPIDKHVLQKLWGYGVVWIDDFNKKRKAGTRSKNDPGRDRQVFDPGVYMSKYMEKDFDDAEEWGYSRAYSPSQNLKQPIPERDEKTIERLLHENDAEEFAVFDKTYPIEFDMCRTGKEPEHVEGTCRYRIFNFRSGARKVSQARFDDAGGVGGELYPPPATVFPWLPALT